MQQSGRINDFVGGASGFGVHEEARGMASTAKGMDASWTVSVAAGQPATARRTAAYRERGQRALPTAIILRELGLPVVLRSLGEGGKREKFGLRHWATRLLAGGWQAQGILVRCGWQFCVEIMPCPTRPAGLVTTGFFQWVSWDKPGECGGAAV
ncbi:hypothetical protein VUR80DRAFT_7792 [Thermomyces stellatus]